MASDKRETSVQSLSRVQLFATPWIAACQASLSITNSRSSPKLICIELVSTYPISRLVSSASPHITTLSCSTSSPLFYPVLLSDCKEIKPVNHKGNQSWMFTGRTDAEAEAPRLWPPDLKNWLTVKTPMLENIEGRKRRDDRGWNSWMSSLTWWTWVWASSRSWWWTGRPGVLQSMALQIVRHDWAIKPQQ